MKGLEKKLLEILRSAMLRAFQRAQTSPPKDTMSYRVRGEKRAIKGDFWQVTELILLVESYRLKLNRNKK